MVVVCVSSTLINGKTSTVLMRLKLYFCDDSGCGMDVFALKACLAEPKNRAQKVTFKNRRNLCLA